MNNSKIWYIYIMSNKHQGVIYVGVTDNLMEVIEISLSLELLLILFGFILLLGVLISYISTWFALNKYLRMKVDDLY